MKKSTVDNIIIMTILNGPESSRQVKLTIKKIQHHSNIFLYVSKVYCHCLQYDCVLYSVVGYI